MDFVFNPMDPEFLRDPYPVFERMRHEHPVYRHPAGFWCVTRYDDVVAVLKDAAAFSSSAMGGRPRPGSVAGGPGSEEVPFGSSLISEDPPVHTQQRAIVNRGFTPGRVRGLEGRIRELAEDLIADVEHKGSCDLTGDFANPFPVSVIVELLGLDPAKRDEIKRLSTDIIISTTRPDAMGDRGRVLDSALAFRRIMIDAVEDRMASPGSDLVSVLVHAQVHDGILDKGQAVSFAGLLLAAGSETTTNLIGNAVASLALEPGLSERVRAEPERIPALVEESLRHDPPVQVLMRQATRDVPLRDQVIPEGSLVMVALGSANRDESRFPEPDRFDLDRSTSGHVAFGFGNHFCLGASLARLEATVALELLLDRLGAPRLVEPEVEYHGSFLIRGPARLPIEYPGRSAS